ncbi:unnamed protein product [Choristocarpus tenellus]
MVPLRCRSVITGVVGFALLGTKVSVESFKFISPCPGGAVAGLSCGQAQTSARYAFRSGKSIPGWTALDAKRSLSLGRLSMVLDSTPPTESPSSPSGPSFLPEVLRKPWERISSDPAKLSFALNTLVIVLFASAAFYKLSTVDMDISRGWTWYEILLRVPGDNFYRYEATVSESPIVTKALTSCVAYGLGDLTAQLFTGKTMETIDLRRTARSATAGLLVHGPLCHYWIMLMQTYLDFDGAWWNFVPKVIADQTVWSLFLNAAYTSMITGLKGKSPEEVVKEVKDTCWPALTSSWRFWPLIHCVSFSTFIPVDLKLLFIDCMEIIWVTILSTVANKDRKNAVENDNNDTQVVGELGGSGAAGGSDGVMSSIEATTGAVRNEDEMSAGNEELLVTSAPTAPTVLDKSVNT